MFAYAAAQAAAPGYLVLYRVGEFYEVLGRDAATVSHALGLQLTRRRQKDADDVPMCGIPAGTSEQTIARLLGGGHKVAVSEQPGEDGRRAPAAPLHARHIGGRRCHPGRTGQQPDRGADRGQTVAFAWIDVSTGEAGATTASLEGCGPALARIAPAEILVARWPEELEKRWPSPSAIPAFPSPI